jgi:PII-like signaling protein
MHTPKVEALSEHLPVRIEFVETAEKVDELLPTLYDMVTDGLIEVHDTTVVKVAAKDKAPEPKPPHTRKQGPARLMRVFIGEADKWQGEPLYDAIVKRLRMMEIDGATVYRGILGYGAKGHTHKQSFWHTSRDLPIMIALVDTAAKLAEAAGVLEGMIEDGLIVTSDVEAVRLVHSQDAQEAPDGGSQAG